MTTRSIRKGAAPMRPVVLCALALGSTWAGASIWAGSAAADIAYDTLTGHSTSALRGFGFGTIFAEDVTLEPGAGRTLVGWRMHNYGNQDYFGTMTLMFARRAPGDTAPDMSRIFASVDQVVYSLGTVSTWIADLPFVEAPHTRLWVMWKFGHNTLGNSSLPSVGSDGNAPSAGSTDNRIYVMPGSSSSWQTIDNERWVMRLDTVPAPSCVAFAGIVACLRVRRHRA